MLIRRFVSASFILLIKNDWSPLLCEEHNAILSASGGPLWCVAKRSSLQQTSSPTYKMLTNLRLLRSPSDPRIPPGLSYHLSEIWLTELDKASATAAAQKPVPLRLVLVPFMTLAAKTSNKVTYQQIQANLIDPLLAALSPPLELDEPPLPKRSKTSTTQDDFSSLLANSCVSPLDVPSDRSQLRKGVLEYIFEVASQEDSKDSNRRKLYAVCNANIEEDDS